MANALGMRLQPFELGQGVDVSNALAPIQRGLDTYREGMDKQFQGERALARERLAQRADDRASESHSMEMQKAKVQQIAGLAQMADQERDPARRSAIMQRVYSMHPDLVPHLQKSGFDPADHMNVPKMLIAEARGFVDPDKKRLMDAQINNLNRREEPDIVRTLRAANVDPKSPEGRQLIMNSLKGGDPISQAIAQQISGQQSAPQSPIRPQSYAPQAEGDPNLVLTQAGGAPQQTQQDMIDVPGLGQMPKSRAELFGLGLALQGKGDAGKMIMEGVNADKLEKAAATENDKKTLAAVEGMHRIRQIASGFKPEWLTYENKAKQYGISWADSFEATRKKLPPDMVKDHVEYTMFKRDAIANLTQGIKDATGAAMGIQEEARIRAGLPDPEKDNPSAFEAKLKGTARDYAMTIARTQYLRRNGFKGDGNAAAMALPIDQFAQRVQQRTNILQQQFLQQNPQASPQQIQSAVRQRLQAEFGLGI